MMTNEESSNFHPWRIAASLLCIAWVALLLTDQAHDLIYGWPDWVKMLAVVSLLFSVLGFVLLFLNGVGLIRTSWLASLGQERAPTAEMFMAVYAGFVVGGVGLSFLLARVFHADLLRSCFAICGVMLLVASSRRPWWVFGTIRRLGWFTLIESDKTMRWLLAVIGILLFLIGVLGRGRPGDRLMQPVSSIRESTWGVRSSESHARST